VSTVNNTTTLDRRKVTIGGTDSSRYVESLTPIQHDKGSENIDKVVKYAFRFGFSMILRWFSRTYGRMMGCFSTIAIVTFDQRRPWGSYMDTGGGYTPLQQESSLLDLSDVVILNELNQYSTG
jgi:hypothetical protein